MKTSIIPIHVRCFTSMSRNFSSKAMTTKQENEDKHYTNPCPLLHFNVQNLQQQGNDDKAGK